MSDADFQSPQPQPQPQIPSYKELYETISHAIAPLADSTAKLADEVKQLKVESAGRPTKDDFESLRRDVRQSIIDLENRTFTRDVIDLRFNQLRDMIHAHEEEAKATKQNIEEEMAAIKTAQMGLWDKFISRWSTVVLLIWILIQMIPYFAKIFH